MSFRIFWTLLLIFLVVLPRGYCEDRQPTALPTQPPLSRAGLGALEHASKLIVAINKLDWKTVEASFSKEDTFFPLLKRDASAQEDWHGIGAYRGFDFNSERSTLTHRFAYGPIRTTPHEVSFHYSIIGDDFKFAGIMIRGW